MKLEPTLFALLQSAQPLGNVYNWRKDPDCDNAEDTRGWKFKLYVKRNEQRYNEIMLRWAQRSKQT